MRQHVDRRCSGMGNRKGRLLRPSRHTGIEKTLVVKRHFANQAESLHSSIERPPLPRKTYEPGIAGFAPCPKHLI